MRIKTIEILLLLLLSCTLYAQLPQAFQYQAVARDGNGVLLSNQTISLRISILENSQGGNTIFEEIHSPVTTNEYGLFTLKVGRGTVTTGNFSSINWSSSAKFLKVELDPSGSNNYILMGTDELLSVPFALSGGGTGGSISVLNDLNDVTTTGVADGQVLKYNSSSSSWLPANDIGGVNGDNWGTQVIQSDATLNGNGTLASTIGIAQQGATVGQVLKWDGTTWSPANDETGSGSQGDDWGNQVVEVDADLILGNGTSNAPISIKGSTDPYRVLRTNSSGDAYWSSFGGYAVVSNFSMSNAPVNYTSGSVSQFSNICNPGQCQLMAVATSDIDRLLFVSIGGNPGVNERVYDLKAGISQVIFIELLNGSYEYKSNTAGGLSISTIGFFK